MIALFREAFWLEPWSRLDHVCLAFATCGSLYQLLLPCLKLMTLSDVAIATHDSL